MMVRIVFKMNFFRSMFVFSQLSRLYV
uniref:Uncharacterized protein n=1 Tax=Anguilla anguilla TaxID=7936 RepID=A0A0E9QNE9_ANGAN